MKLIENEQQLTDLPDGSIIALVNRDRAMRDRIDTEIYQKHGYWTLMDPSDRYDGEDTYDVDRLIISAVRDGETPYVVFDPRELPAELPDFGALVLEHDDWATWRDSHAPNVEALREIRECKARG